MTREKQPARKMLSEFKIIRETLFWQTLMERLQEKRFATWKHMGTQRQDHEDYLVLFGKGQGIVFAEQEPQKLIDELEEINKG